jgi:uncharacterized protein YukE
VATAGEILLNYKEALAQANKLDELAAELERIGVSDLNDTFGEISTGWQGDNAEAFLRKARPLASKNQKTVNKIRNTASAIRTIATNVYNAEMRALELAAARTYH